MAYVTVNTHNAALRKIADMAVVTTHDKALIAIMGATITNLTDALDKIAMVAHFGADKNAKIAKMADDAIEAAKALTKQEY
jgi:hypothetical protein